MDLSVVILGLVGCLIFSIIVTGLLQKYTLSRLLIDIPNERSSHLTPTPRGGGLSIVISTLLCIGILFMTELLAKEIALALGIGCFLVSVVGWIDDHQHIPALWRGIVYGIAALLAVYFLAGFNYFQSEASDFPPGLIGAALAVIWIVWMTNLYNFMDGTDALAAIQAMSVGLFMGILFWLEGQNGVAIVCFVIFISNCGFIFWNYPPAKIFMGDVGSCMLGFCFGVLTIIGEFEGAIPFAVWLILLSIFICDATLTLLMRIINGERWYSAHCSHAYQRWVQMGTSHKRLVISVLLINVLILWPMATMAFVWDEFSHYIVVFSIFLMSVLWGIIQMHYHRDYS